MKASTPCSGGILFPFLLSDVLFSSESLRETGVRFQRLLRREPHEPDARYQRLQNDVPRFAGTDRQRAGTVPGPPGRISSRVKDPGRLPAPAGLGVWRPEKDPAFDRQSVETCAALKDVYSRIAAKRGNAFLAASGHAAACHVDKEHLNAEGHEKLAAAILDKLKEYGIMEEYISL